MDRAATEKIWTSGLPPAPHANRVGRAGIDPNRLRGRRRPGARSAHPSRKHRSPATSLRLP
eukprot:6851940-Pyramimonas_sp.AAC.1